MRAILSDRIVDVERPPLGANDLRIRIRATAVNGKRQQIIGSTLRARPVSEKAEIVASFLRRFGADLEAGRVRPATVSARSRCGWLERRRLGGWRGGVLAASHERRRDACPASRRRRRRSER